MKKIYYVLSKSLVEKNIIEDKNRELYEYAIKVFLRFIINILSVSIIGLLFNLYIESIIMTITIILIRKFSGGVHLKKLKYCYINSLGIAAISLLIIKFIEPYRCESYIFIFSAISIIIISIFSPIENQNALCTSNEKKVFKILSIVFSIILFIMMTLLIKFKTIFLSIGLGINISSILLVIGLIKIRILQLLN